MQTLYEVKGCNSLDVCLSSLVTSWINCRHALEEFRWAGHCWENSTPIQVSSVFRLRLSLWLTEPYKQHRKHCNIHSAVPHFLYLFEDEVFALSDSSSRNVYYR